MAGLAATLNNPGLIDALAAALLPRGAGSAVCRLRGHNGMAVEAAVRAVIPRLPRIVGEASGVAGADENDAQVLAALAVDGVASVSALDAGYAERGAAGLLGGHDPYAVILADAEREELVLARNGNGPGLYYARTGDGWLVASEPTALHSAGLPARPDAIVVQRFIETGACDDTAATFFEGVWRMRPDEAVVLGRDGEIQFQATALTTGEHPVSASTSTSLSAELEQAVAGQRIGVLLTPGILGAALLGMALARSDRRRPLQVHSAVFPVLGGRSSHIPAVLVPLPYGIVRHTSHSFSPADFDLDGFLREMGEPVPDLGLYVLWDIVRTLAGEVDVLVDAGVDGIGGDYMARVSDRLSSRYGVSVCRPLRTGQHLDAEVQSILARTLPPTAARFALEDSDAEPTAAEMIMPVRDAVAAAIASTRYARRPWADPAAELGALRRLCDGEPADDGPLLRTYLVERWLREVSDQSISEDYEALTDLVLDGATWTRVPVRTEVFAAGDPLTGKAAWYVASAVADLRDKRTHREALSRPWFAVIAAKPVAVSQRRICPLWEIKPRRAARLLARVARRWLPRLGDPWTMQVAISDAGLLRVAAGTFAAPLGGSLPERLLPPAASVLFPPREDAVPPADSAVVRGPVGADAFAVAFTDALRYALPPDAYDTLAATAVVSADADSSRVLGFAPGPYVDAVPDADAVVAGLCADNPAGQGSGCTPIVLALRTE